jgi:hypothetical protein
MNTISKFILFILLLATISSTKHAIHLTEDIRLEFFGFPDDGQNYLVRGDGDFCVIGIALCREDNEDWIITHYSSCPEFPRIYRISGARKDQERKELIEFSKTKFYSNLSNCRFKMEQALQFLK